MPQRGYPLHITHAVSSVSSHNLILARMPKCGTAWTHDVGYQSRNSPDATRFGATHERPNSITSRAVVRMIFKVDRLFYWSRIATRGQLTTEDTWQPLVAGRTLSSWCVVSVWQRMFRLVAWIFRYLPTLFPSPPPKKLARCDMFGLGW